MKKIIFILLLSFSVTCCYVPFPSIGKGAQQNRYRMPILTENNSHRRARSRDYLHHRQQRKVRAGQYLNPEYHQHPNIPEVVCRRIMTSYGAIVQSCRELKHRR